MDRPRSAASSAPGMVRELVDQFERPLDFYRELIQNAIDAGSNRVDVSLEHDGERAMIRIEDDGEGMDERTIDDFLLVLFRSTKEGDFTKIGKFGIGFVSVFAIRPERVRVFTARGPQSWRIDFPDYRRYEKYRLSETREGTLVEILKKMPLEDFAGFVKLSREAVRLWCKHSEARIYFRSRTAGAGPAAPPELVSEAFGLQDASCAYLEEGTHISLGFSAEEEPFYGFYNRGLTLKEGNADLFPGVRFKAKSRYLEHTLTRDNVMVDAHYRKLMSLVKMLVEEDLPRRIRPELREIASRISRLYSGAGTEGPPQDELAPHVDAWRQRSRFLSWLFSGYFSRWKRSGWAVFPSLSGRPLTLYSIRKGMRASGGRLYFDTAPNRITRALAGKGVVVLPPGPWLDCLAAWLKVRPLQASRQLILPKLIPERRLAAGLRGLLETLRGLDERSGSRYRGILAAEIAHPGSPLRDKLFVIQKEPGTLSPALERPVSSLLWFRRPRRWALVHPEHPAAEKFTLLHARRPGLAAYLFLKMMYLHDGEVPPERESEYCNLAEKVEAELIAGATRLDAEAGAETRA